MGLWGLSRSVPGANRRPGRVTKTRVRAFYGVLKINLSTPVHFFQFIKLASKAHGIWNRSQLSYRSEIYRSFSGMMYIQFDPQTG